jgi:hypothetical protein
MERLSDYAGTKMVSYNGLFQILIRLVKQIFLPSIDQIEAMVNPL